MWNEDETFQYFFDNILLLSEANKAGCWTHAEPVPPDRSGRLRLCICSSSPIHTPCYRSCLTCLRHNGSHKSPAGSQDEDRLGYSQCCSPNTREFFPLLPSCNSISVIGRQNGFTSLRVHSTGAESCSTGGESSVLNVVADRNH